MSQIITNKIVFEIREKQCDEYLKWRKKIDIKIISQEIEEGRRLCDGKVLDKTQIDSRKKQLITGKIKVYYGVVEQGYIFTCIPTPIINIVRVKNSLTGDEIDLTDYENW
ncbi:hypothetical protein [Limnoraphis robusta]|uniref:DUF4258 domain-containing protein n=1 Tax=Limnoraphis robusta CCNP1315 TaxID=3110306 RepID=A0ABU5U2W5_9CYAN|nr:hypothetical protein [Limnoraphis robusta]MEA5521232.1 hypothetical protein [Limnoraphis robusta CCNP1315]MEA5548968.1 hypothetical protein [Limnoraphis robusta CCNP1324]